MGWIGIITEVFDYFRPPAPFGVSAVRGLHAFALGAAAVNFLKHSLKQGLSRSRWNSSLLKLEHFLTLAPDLDVHAFDFGPDEIEDRHSPP
jgi:hypothetical protein